MKSYPSCWNKTLAQLGFRRKARKNHTRGQYGRRALFENLETREMLAADYTVTTLADVAVAGSSIDTEWSLREAITAANSNANASTIDFADGLTGTIVLSGSQLPAISYPLTIDGPGADKLAISGSDTYRVFQISGSINVTIEGLTIKDGNSSSGAGIYSTGNLTLQNLVVSGNDGSANGGGLYSSGGNVTIQSSTFEDNTANKGGGARIDVTTNTVVNISSSTFANNRADVGSGYGGGLMISGGNTVTPATIVNSTFSGNEASAQSGGIRAASGAQLEITNSTIAENQGQTGDGGISVLSDTNVTVKNSIIAGNTTGTGANSDVGGALNTASSDNLFGIGGPSGGTNNDVLQVGETALLAPLGDYGGPTKTHALLPGSKALNMGGGSGSTVDQRGFERPVGTVDRGATESTEEYDGDFDGDHREEQLQFDPATGTILVVTTRLGVTEIKKWGQLNDSVEWVNPQIGDFNGDGRDDLIVQNGVTKKWTVAISDGNAFFAVDTQTGVAWIENKIQVGDFDGDGSEELIGQIGSTTRQVLHYSEAGGAVLTSIDTQPTLGGVVYVGDANRDGRDDLIRRLSSNTWNVALAQPDGSMAAEFSWGGWFEAEYDDSTLNGTEFNPDAPYQKVLDIFSDIYNNYELEFYPGLMKGPVATEQTKAGNDWDQAALLVRELEALPELEQNEVSIVKGWATAPVTVLKEWIGSPDTSTGTALRDNVRDLMNQLGIMTLNGSTTTTLLFEHVWVQVKVPTSQGLTDVFLDPSWKFEDRQPGILPFNTNGILDIDGVLQTFDQMDYLSSVREELALEYYEDKLVDYLVASYQGRSLADVPYDGPIRTRSFESLPVGMGEGITDPITVITYDNFDAILLDAIKKRDLTHRVVVEMTRISTDASRNNFELFETEVVVPDSPYQRLTINVGSGGAPVITIKELVNGITSVDTINASGNLQSGESVRIKITQLDPGEQADTPGVLVNTYDEDQGTIIAVGLDANQFTTPHIASLQEYLLDELSTVDAGDIDDLLSYTVAAYWQDFNRDNETIAGLMNKAYTKRSVGSGVATAKSAGYEEFDYLNYRIAPDKMGVDLKNGTGTFLDWDGDFNQDAQRLSLYNGSGLEHTVVEETINSPSVSTVKGLQRAYQRTFGINDENGTPVSDDKVHGFDSYWVNGQRKFYYRGEKSTTSSSFKSYQAFQTLQAPDERTESQIRSILTNNLTGFEDKIIAILSDTTHHDDIRILVSDARTKLDEWVGGVYTAEHFGDSGYSISMAIAPDNGPLQNGGYSAGVITPPNPILPPTDFTYSTYAGDPVSTANGAMFRDDVDIVYPNIGVPLDFARHYNSGNKDDVGLGVGWTYSFSDVVIKDPDSASNFDLVWITSSGQRHKLKSLGSGQYEEPPALNGEFTRSGDLYIYRDKSGIVYQFDDLAHNVNGVLLKGRLISQADQLGNGVEITYTDFAYNPRRIAEIRSLEAPNRKLVFDYLTGHATIPDYQVISRVHKYVDSVNVGTWDFGYQFSTGTAGKTGHRLISVAAPSIGAVNNQGQTVYPRPTVAYEYISSGTNKGLVRKITEPDGGTHTYEYYVNGRVFRVTDSNFNQQTYNYNLLRGSAEFVDENGHTEVYIHQENGLLEKQIHDDRTRQEFTWGKVGTLAEFLMASSTDELGATETFKYYVTDATYFDGTDHEYVISTNTFRNRELYEATAKKFPTDPALVTRFDYSTPGGSLSHIVNLKSTIVDVGDTTHQNLTTDFQYDTLGRLIKTIDALGNVTTREYYVAGGEGISYREGLLKAETSGRGNDTNVVSAKNAEYVGWKHLVPSMAITGNTISVRAIFTEGMVGQGKVVDIDAIRIERIDGAFPFVKIIDDDTDGIDNEFRKTGGPTVDTSNAQNYLGDRLALDTTDDSATWVFTGLEPGTYRVSATWKASTSRFTDAPFYVVEGTDFTGAGVIPVNQQQVPSDLPAGFKTVFNYDPAGNVTSAQTDGIPTSTNAYASTGGLTSSTAYSGVANTYTYNVLGWQLTANLVPTIGTPQTGTFSYDASGRVRFSTDPLDRTTEFVYDLKGQLITQKNPDGTEIRYEYDGVGNRTSVTDELGRETRFVYDGRNRLIETIYCDGTSTRIRYNGTGQIAATFDELGRETKFTYDAQGRLMTTTNADDKVATNNYDLVGRLTWTLDFNGNKTEFKYDSLGRVTESRSLSTDQSEILALATTDYDANGNVTRTVRYDAAALAFLPSNTSDPRALVAANPTKVQVTEFRYDSLDRPIETVNADGTSTRTVYDNDGRVKYQYDELGRKTERVYDIYGRLWKTIAPDPDGEESLTSPVTQFQYDAAGNMIKIIDPRVNATEFTYDARNRLVTTTDALGNETHTLYDVAGQVVATVDALGHVMYTLRDKRGRAVLSREADPDGDGPQLAPQTRFAYNEVGNLIEKIDALGNRTTYTYDELNRLTKEVSENISSARIIDDGDEDTVYRIVNGNPENALAGGFQGDVTPIVPVNSNGYKAIAEYKFTNLEPGDYRILATWVDNVPGATDSMSAALQSTSGNVDPHGPTARLGFDQQDEPTDVIYSDEDGQRSWEELFPKVTVLEGGNRTIRLWLRSLEVNEKLIADAVRLQRIDTRTYSYDYNGNLLSETDTLGRITTYDYDALDRQKKVTLPDPDGTGTGNPSPVTDTVYDGFGNVKQTIEQRGGQPRTTEYTYDKLGRVLTETLDKNGAQQVITQFQYDAVGNLKSTIEDVGGVEARTEYDYDNLNREIEMRRYRDAVDALPLRTLTTYDAAGNVLTTTESTGYDIGGGDIKEHLATTSFTYDKLNRLATSTVEDGVVWEELSDGFQVTGDKLTVRLSTPGGANQWVVADAVRLDRLGPNGELFDTRIVDNNPTSADPRFTLSSMTHYESDGHPQVEYGGDATVIYGPESAVWAFTGLASGTYRVSTLWVASANPASNRHPAAPFEIFNGALEAGTPVVETVDMRYIPQGFTGATTTFTYDAAGNLIAETDPLGFVTVSEYDRLNRLVKTTSPDPDPGAPGLTDNTPFTTFTYDALGRLIAETNGEGETMSYVYDALGNLIRETDGLGQTTGKSTLKTYDSEGNLLSITDPEDNRTSYTYDNLNRILTDTIELSTGIAVRTYTYNAQGNLSEYLDREGRRTVYGYDRLDRVTSEFWYESGGSWVHIIGTDYDKLGRVTANRDYPLSTGAVQYQTFEYDDLGRVTTARNYDPENLAATPGPKVEQRYVYDVLNTADWTSYVRTEYRQWSYDGSAYDYIGTTITFTDMHGRTARIADTAAGQATKWVEFTYDDADHLIDVTRTAGTFFFDTRYEYDNAGRVTSILHDLATDIVHEYEYDRADRVTTFDTTGSGTVDRDYGYDDAGQLTSSTGFSAENLTYQYDDNGNRTVVGSQTWATGAHNRLTDDGDYTYLYDKEGNVTSKTNKFNALDITEYAYDHRNRLVQVQRKEGVTVVEQANYQYDADNRRVLRSDDPDGSGAQTALKENFVYDASDIALSIDNAGELQHRYLHSPVTGEVLADEVFDGIGDVDLLLWPVADMQGTIRDIVDNSGIKRKHVDYTAEGRILNMSWYNGAGQAIGPNDVQAVDQLFYYTGLARDELTGFYRAANRDYDPQAGRWTSEDTISAPNLYEYGNNSWPNNIDPSGRSPLGNPLNNLFGGYSGGKVEPYKPININPYQYVAPKLQTQILSTGLGYGSSSGNSFGISQSDIFAASRSSYSAGSFLGPVNSSKNIDFTDFGSSAPSFDPYKGSTTFARPSTKTIQSLLPTGPTLLDQVNSVVYAGAGGLKTGGKAAVNSLASTAVSFATLGFKSYNGPFGVTQADLDIDYDAASFSGRIGFETLSSLATGGLSQLGKAGTAVNLVGKTALAYDTAGNVLSVGRGLNDAYNNGVGFGNSVQIVGGALGFGGNIAAGNKALREIASDAGRLRVEPAGLYGGVPVPKVSLAPKVHLNTNSAVGHFGIYDLLVNGELYKVGKAHLDRITQSSGLATRIHQQVRILSKTYDKVEVGPINDLGRTTTSAANLAEKARLHNVYNQTGVVPPGNIRSYRPNQ